jgi:hypothetical protein
LQHLAEGDDVEEEVVSNNIIQYNSMVSNIHIHRERNTNII